MGIYEAIKDGIEVAQKADNIEVMKQLLQAQKEALDLFDENRRLKERIRELEASRVLENEVKLRDGLYYRQCDGGEPDGPFCTTCWDADRKLIRLQHDDDFGWMCGICVHGRR